MDKEQINSKTIANSLWWKLLERLFSQGINLVVQIILARILLPSDFGSLAIIVAITNYAAIFVQTGLSTVLIQKKNLAPEDTSTMLTASMVIALFFFIVLFFLAPWISSNYNLPEILWPLRVLSLILFLNAINSVQTALLARSMNFKTIFIRSAVSVPVSGAVGIAMAYMGFGVWALVTHNLLNMLIMVIVMFIGTDVKMKFGFSLIRAKEMYSFSGKIMLSGLISGLGDTVRTMTIGKRYTPNDLAYYDKAYTYAQYVVHIIHSSIQSVMLPVFSRQQDNLIVLRDTNRKTVSMVSFVMFPVLIGAIMAAKPLILLLLTGKWALSIPYFMLFCFFRLLGCVTSVDKQAYYALGKSGLALCFEAGLLVANLVILFSVVNYGVWSIAVGATIVEFFGCFTLCVISSKVYGYKLSQRFIDIKLPFFNSLIMAGALYLIGLLALNNLWILLLQVVAGIIVYYVMAKLTKDKNIDILKTILFKK